VCALLSIEMPAKSGCRTLSPHLAQRPNSMVSILHTAVFALDSRDQSFDSIAREARRRLI
jgi:hypothetical protein